MITRAVVAPVPPLLVPELVPGLVERTARVRDACLAAVQGLAATCPHWIAIGVAEHAVTVEPGARGSFRGFGVDVPVTLSAGMAPGEPADLPLPALLAGWLRERAGAESVRVELLPESTSVDRCIAAGERLAGLPDDVGLLVLGDGSTRHETAPPGWPDERAAGFDATVADAFADADPEPLLRLDAGLADELGAGGRVPWQVLAGLARARPPWRGKLCYSHAPLGVAYHVAVWEQG
ncbi:class III extradiol dioxygenase subunit B-like domain-containing protein [Saccharomonospora sp. NPDC046836]|uniref:class III extradiol dioxygenase subunit B-like domain-containing protein n=1 Tax=Saccharomonospora sp. NPDC046836 TaxID=3156921 RepID=UPI0033E91ACB